MSWMCSLLDKTLLTAGRIKPRIQTQKSQECKSKASGDFDRARIPEIHESTGHQIEFMH